MSSREDILQNIRRNTRVRYEKPDLSALEQGAITYADQVAQFCKVVAEVGGRVVTVNEGEDVNALVRKLYPDAKRIASNLKNITCATFHPDDVEASADLDGTDLAVVDGRIGVCENGAVWVKQDVEQRAVYFISEALILLLDRKNLVNNMHEAYQKIDTGEYGYGVFISGPSKTADIEQALVMGAHGARELTVLLL